MEREISPDQITDAKVRITHWERGDCRGVVQFHLTDGSVFETSEMGYTDAVALRYDTGLETIQ